MESVNTEIRYRQIDKIVKPYAVLHSMQNTHLDMMMSPIYYDKCYDDDMYDDDPSIVDPPIPEKEVRAVYDAEPGSHRNLEAILKRRNR